MNPDRAALPRMLAAEEDDAEACLDAAGESHNGDEFATSGTVCNAMADALDDALEQLSKYGRVSVAWSVKAHRLIEEFRSPT